MRSPSPWRTVRSGFTSARTALATRSGRRIGDAAAESAFFVALAILPMMLTTTAVLRTVQPWLGVDATDGVERGLGSLLRVVLSARGAGAAEAAEQLLRGTSSSLLTVGTVISFLILTRAMRSALTGMHALTASAGAVTHTPRRREWPAAFGLAAVTVLVAATMLAMLVLGPLFGFLGELAPGSERLVATTWSVVRWPVGVLALYLYVVLVQSVGLREAGAARQSPFGRPAMVGATLTAAGILASSVILPVYVNIAGNLSPTVGVLGGGLILLTWAYLLMLSLLIGSQLRLRMSTSTSVAPAGRHTPETSAP